jgi:hypothetical protein
VRQGVSKADGPPTLYMTGGGFGSGKSTMRDDPDVGFPKEGKAVVADPDAMKAALPEYREGIDRITTHGEDYPELLHQVHAESSHLAKEAARRGLHDGYDVIYDTSGNGGFHDLAAKVADFRAHGAAKVIANYAWPGSIEAAQNRANGRVQQTHGARRPVDPKELATNHKQVSYDWHEAARRGTFDKLYLWSTAGPLGSHPTLIATAEGGKITVHNPERYRYFAKVGGWSDEAEREIRKGQH